ncbi:hypothetical protein BDY21DRAFT_353833 [Lineolata rhizophorae]|uniref:MARVEL domain-containing protein n=1 Tax=Lineolata rhizophorae TaxID=578093 RepID=A0A6A6NR23_9PEZI|nr:hypothetical protein BDY21DRAFT_353833 [Lineolata rhizophorae]
MFNLSEQSKQGGAIGLIFRTLVRFLQLVLALTVCGLYGTDLNAARKADKYADSKWVYAVVVAGMSAVTCLVYLTPFIKAFYAFAWDFVLWVLWLAAFGVFGKLYIGEDPEGNGGIERMKNAVWVDLVNMLLWFITFVYSTFVFFHHRKRSLHTGRAKV